MVKLSRRLTRTGWSAFFSPLRMIAISGCCFFISAGRLGMMRGWIYYLLVAALSLGGSLLLFFRSPELLNERGRLGDETARSDKVLLLLLFAANLILLPAVAGFETGRCGLAQLPDCWILIGIALQLIGSAVVLRAMLANPFFEGTARWQRERGQHVVSRGPYSCIRHPGYLGMIVNTLPLPLIAGSKAALYPALLAIVILVIRTFLEDRMLLEHLPGYREYARRVRYRLLPPLW